MDYIASFLNLFCMQKTVTDSSQSITVIHRKEILLSTLVFMSFGMSTAEINDILNACRLLNIESDGLKSCVFITQ